MSIGKIGEISGGVVRGRIIIIYYICTVACGELVLHYDTYDRPKKRAMPENQNNSSEQNSKDEIQTERQRLVSKFQRAKKKYKLLGKSEEDIQEKEKLKKVSFTHPSRYICMIVCNYIICV